MWNLLTALRGLVFSAPSDSISDTGRGNLPQEKSGNSICNLIMKKDIQMLYGSLQGASSVAPPKLTIQLDRPTALILQAATEKLFTNSYFDICRLKDIMKASGLGSEAHPNYRKLHALHCIHYSEMSSELKAILPQLVNQLLAEEPRNEAAQSALAGITSL